eukprot:417081-Pyramimonas_sp.AAC.1
MEFSPGCESGQSAPEGAGESPAAGPRPMATSLLAAARLEAEGLASCGASRRRAIWSGSRI